MVTAEHESDLGLGPPDATSSIDPRRVLRSGLTVRGRLLSPRFLAIGSALAAALVLGLAAMFLLGGGPEALAREAALKLAARDKSVTTVLAGPDAMDLLANEMGIAGVPASITFSIDNLRSTPQANRVTDVRMATDVPAYLDETAPAAVGQASEGTVVSVSYTLKATGPDGLVGQADQTLTGLVAKGADGNTHLFGVSVDRPFRFDPDAYYGEPGTSAEDAGRIADDLRRGNGWLGSIAVSITPSDDVVDLPDEIVPAANHLTGWSHTEREAIPGGRTNWTVTVTDTSMGGDVISFAAASAVTKQAVAARVAQGTLDREAAIESAKDVISEFGGFLAGNGATGLNAAVIAGDRPIDASGIAAMVRANPSTVSDELIDVHDDDSVLTVTDGDFTVVLTSDATWKIDAGKSRLVATELAGDGKVHKVDTSRYWGKSRLCSGTVSASLVGVAFYTNGAGPTARFALKGEGDGDCQGTGILGEASVVWKGNAGGTTSYELRYWTAVKAGETVYPQLTLPEPLNVDKAPVTFHIVGVAGQFDSAFDAATK